MDDAFINRQTVAINVKGARLYQGLSQTELAKRSGVDLSSVYRVEKGKSAHSATLKKIARGLNVVFGDLLIERSRNVRAFDIHRSKLAKWFPSEDSRQRLPEDYLEGYRNESERRRLGSLGFVPFFMCPPLIIPPNGPGIVTLELYNTIDGPFNSEFYEDGALYTLAGKAQGTIRDEPFELEEGDWISFKTKDLSRLGVAPSYEVAVMLWIGATRTKKAKDRASDV